MKLIAIKAVLRKVPKPLWGILLCVGVVMYLLWRVDSLKGRIEACTQESGRLQATIQGMSDDRDNRDRVSGVLRQDLDQSQSNEEAINRAIDALRCPTPSIGTSREENSPPRALQEPEQHDQDNINRPLTGDSIRLLQDRIHRDK